MKNLEKLKDTIENDIYKIVYCKYCQIDTAGNHEWDCPKRIMTEQLKNKSRQKIIIPLNNPRGNKRI